MQICRRAGVIVIPMTLQVALMLSAVTMPGQNTLAADDAKNSSIQKSDIDFEKQIRPILLEHCSECHGPNRQKGGLRLDARHGAFHGGESGLVIVPGHPEDSELIVRISSTDADQMPPEGPRLSDRELHLLSEWIEDGAVWPETDYDRDAAMDPRLNHWAWQPVAVVDPPPAFRERLPDGWNSASLNPIDRFILRTLHESELQPSSMADRRSLIRRLSFDLRGLPPTPAEIDDFERDTGSDAYEKLVDRMLASPRYGERWARHWLDVAHYADTHGFERDQRRDHAWRYRDWVIRAFNQDLPYDQFLRLQIAGDVIAPDDPDGTIATGFLAAGPWDFVGQKETPSPVLRRLARADDLDDMVTQVMTASCGLTINCARCHDHKLDPVSQREYYSLWAVFSGVKREDRLVSSQEKQQRDQQRDELSRQIAELRARLSLTGPPGIDLADVVGGGDGFGTGNVGSGIDPNSGQVLNEKRGFIAGAVTNTFHPVNHHDLIDGVVIPSGGSDRGVCVTSTGIVATSVPKSSGQAWDAIRNGAVHSQYSTELGGVDFSEAGHSLLSTHANAGITFHLKKMAVRLADRFALRGPIPLRLVGQVGYFGQTPKAGASIHILADGLPLFERKGLGRDDGLIEIDCDLPADASFLTLLATDNGNGISHDQICFCDLKVVQTQAELSETQAAENLRRMKEAESLRHQIARLNQQRDSIPEPALVYAVAVDPPQPVHLLSRGNPEQPLEVVSPGTVSCLPQMESNFGDNSTSDSERRRALASWITSPDNPLTPRVLVNRLWHYHFGVGLVDTPSDFGLGGGKPSHSELLDWLASEFVRNGWSVKAMHRLICTSSVYRQKSTLQTATPDDDLSNWQRGREKDADNRLLWRQNPRRLDAESIRDAVLTVSGKLNLQMFGPGYQDFEYIEEYAPVYRYITADSPELWRRTIYRFVVRTTPDPFLTTMDCPNPANMTPARNVTTTALQSLAMMNDEFMLKQAGYFADRLEQAAPGDRQRQIQMAFRLAFGRPASEAEESASFGFVDAAGMHEFCRSLMNANEFVYID
ncbi:MAG: DUF1553 domain-containing protein [Planctomycetaceae bacterium]